MENNIEIKYNRVSNKVDVTTNIEGVIIPLDTVERGEFDDFKWIPIYKSCGPT